MKLALVAVLGGSLATLAIAGAGKSGAWPSWRTPAADPEHGKILAETCLACHGKSAPPGDPAAPKLHHQRRSYLYFALRDYKSGARKSAIMQPMAQALSEQDMRDVAGALAGEMLDKPPPVRSEKAIFRRAMRECVWCHGETGIGELEGMPVLTGQDPAYLVAALDAYRTGARNHLTMRGVARSLSRPDAEAFADYYASHQWLEANP